LQHARTPRHGGPARSIVRAVRLCTVAVVLLHSNVGRTVSEPGGAAIRRRLRPPILIQLRGGQGYGGVEDRRTRTAGRRGPEANENDEAGLLERTLLEDMGKGEGGQNDMAEEILRQMPKGLSDWRHNFRASSGKKTYDVSSKFKRRFSFGERVAMAAKIAASPGVVPVVAERLHDGIQLPDTLKPKFSVPAALALDKFVVILKQKLPWTDLYSRHSNVRLFVKEGREMAVAANMGELHLLHKDEDGFLYLTFADSWRPDMGRGEDTSDVLTKEELDRMLEVSPV